MNRYSSRSSLLIVSALFSGVTSATGTFKTLGLLTQAQFQTLAEDVGAALVDRKHAPNEPLGITGFDLGVNVSYTKLETPILLDTASGGAGVADEPESLIVPRLYVQKGLPLGIDLDVSYTEVPDTNPKLKLVGGGISYAFLKGNVALPSLSVRVSYSSLSGSPDLDFKSQGVELGISKGIGPFTPYAGIGRSKLTMTPTAITAPNVLTEAEVDVNRTFVGANLNLGLFDFGFDAEKAGDNTSYGLKLGFRH